LYRYDAGIEKFGIDPSSWKKIIEEFCPGRDVLFIRIKASRAIGSQGLNRYHGWIGSKVRGEAPSPDTIPRFSKYKNNQQIKKNCPPQPPPAWCLSLSLHGWPSLPSIPRGSRASKVVAGGVLCTLPPASSSDRNSLTSPPRFARYSQEDLAAEYARNKAIGVATGCWKGGILVENDHGGGLYNLNPVDPQL
jgi:hypothetical protein